MKLLDLMIRTIGMKVLRKGKPHHLNQIMNRCLASIAWIFHEQQIAAFLTIFSSWIDTIFYSCFVSMLANTFDCKHRNSILYSKYQAIWVDTDDYCHYRHRSICLKNIQFSVSIQSFSLTACEAPNKCNKWNGSNQCAN